jgi:hypothetical protein
MIQDQASGYRLQAAGCRLQERRTNPRAVHSLPYLKPVACLC